MCYVVMRIERKFSDEFRDYLGFVSIRNFREGVDKGSCVRKCREILVEGYRG